MFINIGWPEGIYLVLFCVSLGVVIAKFGEQKSDHYDLVDLLAPFLGLGLLYWGGFFN